MALPKTLTVITASVDYAQERKIKKPGQLIFPGPGFFNQVAPPGGYFL
jgi:hypothetical protein